MKPTQVLGAKDQLNNMKLRSEEPVEDFVRDMQLKAAHIGWLALQHIQFNVFSSLSMHYIVKSGLQFETNN